MGQKKPRCLPHINKVLPRLIGRTEVGHFAFIDHADLIKMLVEGLSSLVNRDYGGQMESICCDAKSLDEFQCSGSIKATS